MKASELSARYFAILADNIRAEHEMWLRRQAYLAEQAKGKPA
jgi:hypothetical protein